MILHVAATTTLVTLGLDPRALYLSGEWQVQSPRVEPEDDGRWIGHVSRGHA
jgi:hypothetical protein